MKLLSIKQYMYKIIKPSEITHPVKFKSTSM